MSDNEITNEVAGGQASAPVGIDSHPKWQRKVVAPRSIVPPRTTVAALSQEDLQQAILAAVATLQSANETKAKREARKQAKVAALPQAVQKAAAATGRKPGSPSLPSLFIDDVVAGKLGECAAEAKENTVLVRRWNGSFWELTTDIAGKAEAMDWLRRFFPDAAGESKSADCWKSLQLHLYKHNRFAPPERDEEVDGVVIPLLDGYLHVDSTFATLRAPDKALGLTFQVKSKSGVKHGQDFIPSAVPEDSLFGQYLATSLPDPELRALVQEQCAMSFVPNTHQTVAWWVGEGGAGKGTLSKLIEAFHHKVATLDLHKLDEPHHLEALVDASIIRVDEVAQKGVWGEKQFKSIVSGDVFMVNPKHKTNYTHRTTAYWIITTNQPPLIRDESDGVRRRIIPVPWPSSARERGNNVRNLDAKIMKRESHLVLGWIVEGLQRYLRRGGPVELRDLPAPVKELMTKIHRQNDNVEQWFEECEVVPAEPKYGYTHTKKEIYQSYVHYTENNGGNVLKEESFWIRFWRRPGLKAAGVAEYKGTAKNEMGETVRVKEIRNLALTPKEVATVKKDQLVEEVISRGNFRVERQAQTVVDDPFAEQPTERQEVREDTIPEFTPAELEELDRLERLSRLKR